MIFQKIERHISVLLFRIIYRYSFKYFGKKVNIICPLKLNGPENIQIGDNVNIEYKTWLAAKPIKQFDDCSLVINAGTSIGHFNHIYCTKSIYIGENVLTADKVYISDNLHGYQDINVPIMHQQVRQVGIVEIGSGTWIGENACIIGAKIGKQCVIGANSVVTKDIPDYSVAVGVPAKIIKTYDHTSGKWINYTK